MMSSSLTDTTSPVASEDNLHPHPKKTPDNNSHEAGT
jgi:hypothetical protein